MTLPIPVAALDDRLAFIGNSGSGKTYAAGVAVEQAMARGHRAVIVDPLGVWWGLRLGADGRAQGFIAVADRALEIITDGYDHQPDDPDDLAGGFTFETVWANNLRRQDYYDVDPVTGLPRKFKFTRGGGG